jgi:uncharacterized protein
LKRDITPDVLRGFALLGILVVNIPFMALQSEEGARAQYLQGFANSAAAFLIFALFQGKFYLIFSLLFGYSSGYIIKSERSNRVRWFKRCLALISIGILHFTFLWHGDILFLYGVFGILLIPFLFRSDRTLKIWARVVIGFFALLLLTLAALTYLGERFGDADPEFLPASSRLDKVLLSGNFIDAIAPRVELWTLGIFSGILLQGGFVFGAFLLGLRLSRSEFLSLNFEKQKNEKLIKFGFAIGLPIQVIAATIFLRNELTSATSEAIYLLATVISFVAAPFLSMGYVGFIRKLASEAPHKIAWIAPAGKMSLTNYIVQSVATSLIFGPWGLGLFQKLDLWLVFLLAFIIWVTLVKLSNLWLQKFPQGPLEKLVAKITN